MKINPIQQQEAIQSYRTNRVVRSNSGANLSKMDEVTFSQEAVSFSKILTEVKTYMEACASTRSVRADEIARLIQSGEYDIESEKVAEKIINDIMGTVK